MSKRTHTAGAPLYKKLGTVSLAVTLAASGAVKAHSTTRCSAEGAAKERGTNERV